jgi:hypothetical protein
MLTKFFASFCEDMSIESTVLVRHVTIVLDSCLYILLLEYEPYYRFPNS